MDETRQRIMDATMALVRDKGYAATTTKDIARQAGVNECTIFRKFKGKKDIILNAMEEKRWRPELGPGILDKVSYELEPDLRLFMRTYLERVTADFVGLSIGLRAPQIYEETAPLIMKTPQSFMDALKVYFKEMAARGLIAETDFDCLAMTIFSATFGYTFLKASFEDRLTPVEQDAYIAKSVALFVRGIERH
nr:TetR/AcrR family transcriptional regulator [Eubacterium sp. 1001713B170207_170306_E7]